jgi:adenosylmethionine-8-amino-7-oxononanoate aminotransferase
VLSRSADDKLVSLGNIIHNLKKGANSKRVVLVIDGPQSKKLYFSDGHLQVDAMFGQWSRNMAHNLANSIHKARNNAEWI